MVPKNGQQQALEKILQRASIDIDFRKQLLVEPKKAILDALGVRVPPTFRVKFIEKAEDVDALIVLPELQRTDGELSDRELDSVSGGGDGESDQGEWW
jgi:hypothetical protein